MRLGDVEAGSVVLLRVGDVVDLVEVLSHTLKIYDYDFEVVARSLVTEERRIFRASREILEILEVEHEEDEQENPLERDSGG